MKPPRIIQTDRLVLRKPRRSDAAAIFRGYAADPEVTRYVMWRPHQDPGQTLAFVSGCIEAWQGEDRFPFVITLAGKDEAVGMIELHPKDHRCGIGYVLARRYWGKGYITEAVRAVIQWLFNQPGIYRVDATCDLENTASFRVMEKAGMQREGILRRWVIHPNLSLEPRDCYVYAIVKP